MPRSSQGAASLGSLAAQVAVAALLLCGARAAVLQLFTGQPFKEGDRLVYRQKVLDMFYHGYDSYLRHAFPADELRPLSKTGANSLGELGNLNLEHLNDSYSGVALTLVDSLSSLAVLGNASEFRRAACWVAQHVTFDQDVRVNVFEANIRLLGGLLSAHLLAGERRNWPGGGCCGGGGCAEAEAVGAGAAAAGARGYGGELLVLAYDLGVRLLPAFLDSPTGIPYAWVNLRHGVRPGETGETNTAAAGSLTLEMGLLSRLTGNPVFEEAARRALRALWALRSPLDLLGTALHMEVGTWLGGNGGIGPSADSFYEYLLKAYILFGDEEYWAMFTAAYSGALRWYKAGAWYHDALAHSGQATHLQFSALHAFWPGLQVLAGDLGSAQESFLHFWALWRAHGLLPERYVWAQGALHPTEQYYPLRPELVESCFYLFQATRNDRYLDIGRQMLDSLNAHTRVEGGYATVASVVSKEVQDHMPSYFLAETAMYLFLLFDDSFMQGGDYLFTTEGHPISVSSWWAPHHAPSARLAPQLAGLSERARLLVEASHKRWEAAAAEAAAKAAAAEHASPAADAAAVEAGDAEPADVAAAGGEFAAGEPVAADQPVDVASDGRCTWNAGTSSEQPECGAEAASAGAQSASCTPEASTSQQCDADSEPASAAGRSFQGVAAAAAALLRRVASMPLAVKPDTPQPSSSLAVPEHDAGQSDDACAAGVLSQGSEAVPTCPALPTKDSANASTLGSLAMHDSEVYHQHYLGCDWGLHASNASALDARVCPALHLTASRQPPPILSLCHRHDARADYSCDVSSDCGIDARLCRQRVCTQHHFCQTPS